MDSLGAETEVWRRREEAAEDELEPEGGGWRGSDGQRRGEAEGLAEKAVRKGVLWQQRDKLFSRWKVIDR